MAKAIDPAVERGASESVLDLNAFTTIIASFVTARSGVPAASIGPDYDLVASAVLDSVSTLELLFFVEERCGVQLDKESFRAEAARTPGRLFQQVEAARARRRAS